MVDGGNQYQGFAELDQQVTDQGYTNPIQSQQAAQDIVIIPQQQGQAPPANDSGDGPNDINQSLMDSVGQHDVFSPGQ